MLHTNVKVLKELFAHLLNFQSAEKYVLLAIRFRTVNKNVSIEIKLQSVVSI